MPLVAQMVKNLPAVQETWDPILRLGRSPGKGNGYPLQYSCWEPHGRRSHREGHSARRQRQTQLSNSGFSFFSVRLSVTVSEMLPTTPPSSFPHWIGTSFVTSRVTAGIKENSEASSHRRHYDFCLDCSQLLALGNAKSWEYSRRPKERSMWLGSSWTLPPVSHKLARHVNETTFKWPIPLLSFIVPSFAWNVPLVSLNFLEEISSPSHWVVSLLFLCINHWGRLSYLSLLFLGTLHSNGYIFPFSPLPLASLLFSAIHKASSDNHFCLFAFLFLGDGLDPCLLFNVTNSLHSSSGTQSIRSNPLNLFVTSTVFGAFDLGHTWMV